MIAHTYKLEIYSQFVINQRLLFYQIEFLDPCKEANWLKYGDDLFNVVVQLFSNDGAITKQKKHEVQKARASFSFSSFLCIIQHLQYQRQNFGHIDLDEFMKRVKDPSVSYEMEPTINSGIHLVAAFPTSTQNLEFVLALANRYDPMTRSGKDEEGKKILIRLDDDFFDTIFKCPHIDQYANIDMQLAISSDLLW